MLLRHLPQQVRVLGDILALGHKLHEELLEAQPDLLYLPLLDVRALGEALVVQIVVRLRNLLVLLILRSEVHAPALLLAAGGVVKLAGAGGAAGTCLKLLRHSLLEGRGAGHIPRPGARRGVWGQRRDPALLAVPGSQLPFRGQACLDGQGLVGGVVDELRVVGVQAWVLTVVVQHGVPEKVLAFLFLFWPVLCHRVLFRQLAAEVTSIRHGCEICLAQNTTRWISQA
mmetsp:Transcript_32661/g.78038  ORF Transcript_32661/g.78038 Transcript_32661/m.78038 type:complete len:228 (-) Transcript_32661:12-695(-)